MPFFSERERGHSTIRRRILEELPEQVKSSPAKPFVNYRCLPIATQWEPDLILTQLEILEHEGRVELRRLANECAVKLTALGAKSLELPEEEWQISTSSRIVEMRKPDIGELETAVRNPQSEARTQATQVRAFVSHATQDRSFVEKFATDLRANGIEAWYSGWEIKPGDSIRAKIEEGLEGCEFFIIVLSKSSIARPWVQTELDAATIRKLRGKVRKIIPIKIGDCGDLPPTLGSLCWEDFSNQPYESALKRVLYSIFEIDSKPRLGSPPTASLSDLGQFQIRTLMSAEPKVSGLPQSGATTKFPISMDALETFANQLSSEGFDARPDLFNGQVGLIVGPTGLDPNRLSSEMAGLFLPLWELNYEGNRALVASRRFHDIVENRPSDWKFNRPYQRMESGTKMRHWNRSATLLGRRLDEEIQQELIRRFPPSDFPVNIDVVGGQMQTYAMVQVTSFDAGIDEKDKAVPEDFLDSGGMRASVIAAVERILLRLWKAGKLPEAVDPNNIRVSFQSSCPNCGKPTTHQFGAQELKNLLATEELKLYCIRCDHQWKPGSQERLSLANWIESKAAGE